MKNIPDAAMNDQLLRIFGNRISISEKELSLALGISRISLWKHRGLGHLRCLSAGRRVLYTLSQVTDFLNWLAREGSRAA